MQINDVTDELIDFVTSVIRIDDISKLYFICYIP